MMPTRYDTSDFDRWAAILINTRIVHRGKECLARAEAIALANLIGFASKQDGEIKS